jgi:hypothetical protein
MSLSASGWSARRKLIPQRKEKILKFFLKNCDRDREVAVSGDLSLQLSLCSFPFQ